MIAEFVINRRLDIQIKTTIEKIFEISVTLDNSNTAGICNSKICNYQWITLEGHPTKCGLAKEFIIGLSSPEKYAYILCPQIVHTILKNSVWLHVLQRKSRAVIEVKPNNFVNIYGLACNVALAKSSLELLIKSISCDESSSFFGFDSELESEFFSVLLQFELEISDYKNISNVGKRNLLFWLKEYKEFPETNILKGYEEENKAKEIAQIFHEFPNEEEYIQIPSQDVKKKKRTRTKTKMGVFKNDIEEAPLNDRIFTFENNLSPIAKKQNVYDLSDLMKDFSKNTTSSICENTKREIFYDHGNIKVEVSKSENSQTSSSFRPIVLDGSNIAMLHGNSKIFSCRGIRICVNYFKTRGHKNITAFVPRWRTAHPKPENPILDQHVLFELVNEGILKLTPSREVNGKNIVCYDDRFIVQLAAETGGIIVSNDNFRDLMKESSLWKETIVKRLLMYTFVGDLFMPPGDPLGKDGPKLSDFLMFPLSTTSSTHTCKRQNIKNQSIKHCKDVKNCVVRKNKKPKQTNKSKTTQKGKKNSTKQKKKFFPRAVFKKGWK